MSTRGNLNSIGVCLSVVILLMLGVTAPAQASVILYEFNGTGAGGATVHATMGLDSSVTTPNHTFDLTNVSSFSVQFTGAFTASGSALPASLSGQRSSGSSPVFSSLFVNDSLTVPGHGGTNNFQFYSTNGQGWSFAVTGPAPGPVQITGTGTWNLTPVPLPAAVILFGSGLAGLVGSARRHMHRKGK